ncbi:hypothetical protein TruAng_008110 [Truncatella angustata]|nr:hypothetical protein TruAng_008110 [Truncatella angustata]
MLELVNVPFTPHDVKPTTVVDAKDTSFRYQPNIICSACRELLSLGLELHRKHGRQMAEFVQTKFEFADLLASADLGCHLCALLRTGMLGVANGEPIPAPSWGVAFSVQRAAAEEALYQITLDCSGPPGENQYGSIRRGYLRVYPRDYVDYAAMKPPPAAHAILGRSTGDEETFALAESWLKQCLDEHPLCAENDDEARIVRPARLLYLDGTIKLVDSAEAQGEKYVTLSHCWGKQTYVPRLLFETEATLRGGVDIDYLPKTFQDAVTVTRKLGYKYIWIDSLCIIQDSPEDWEDQAKIMALVYVNSVFTIAALKSPGSSGGCFTNERNPLGLRPLVVDELGITIAHSIPTELWEAEVNTSGYGASPLHTRSWVVQERLSSPRTLLYGAFSVYWECRCAQGSELHYRKLAWDDPNNKKTWLQKLEGEDSWMDHWIDLLKTYSSCELTMKTDKIIAVTGLISEVERRSKTSKHCILGLWSDDLAGMLLWYRARNDMNLPTDMVGRLENGMPTWTWASVEGRCSYLSSTLGIIEWQAVAEVNTASTPATMALESWRRKVLLDEDNSLVLDPDDPKTGQKGWGGDLDDVYSWFCDCEMPPAEQELYLVPIRRARITGSSPLWVTQCLLVSPLSQAVANKGQAVFTRVGVSTVRFGRAKDDPFKSKDPEAREVIGLQ